MRTPHSPHQSTPRTPAPHSVRESNHDPHEWLWKRRVAEVDGPVGLQATSAVLERGTIGSVGYECGVGRRRDPGDSVGPGRGSRSCRPVCWRAVVGRKSCANCKLVEDRPLLLLRCKERIQISFIFLSLRHPRLFVGYKAILLL